MIDKKSREVLKELTEKVGYDFKVFSREELYELAGKNAGMDFDTFSGTIKFLHESGYIDVKFYNGDDICLAITLEAAALVDEKNNLPEKTSVAKRSYAIIFAVTFVAATLGGILANVITSLFG